MAGKKVEIPVLTLMSDFTYAAARIHAESSSDLEQATADGIASSIKRDLTTPIVGFGLGWDVPVPDCLIDIPEPERERDRAEVLDIALNKLQLQIRAADVYKELRIAIPPGMDEDEILRAKPLLAGTSVSPAVADKLPEPRPVPGGGGTPRPPLRE